MSTRRRAPRILERDLAALRLIGRWRCIARHHLKEWLFAGVDDAVVSRFVARMTKRGYLGARRLHGVGIQLLWLTSAGRDFLGEHGTPVVELFPAKSAVPLKDLDHTLAIVSAGFALQRRFPAADALLPAWAVQRAFGGQLAAVPDLLCIDRSTRVLLAVEIDIGGEALVLFADKLVILGSWLARWAADARPAIIVFTSGDRRAAILTDRLSAALDSTVGLGIEELPKGLSRATLTAFCGIFGISADTANRHDELSGGDDGAEGASC